VRFLTESGNLPDNDRDQSGQLKALSWLSASELGLRANAPARQLQTASNKQAAAPDAQPVIHAVIYHAVIHHDRRFILRADKIGIATAVPPPKG